MAAKMNANLKMSNCEANNYLLKTYIMSKFHIFSLTKKVTENHQLLEVPDAAQTE